MSIASRARQTARLLAAAVPVGDQPIEQAQAQKLALHRIQNSRQSDVMAEAVAHFGEEVKLKRQRGRWFLVVRGVDKQWKTCGSGNTQREALMIAVQRESGLTRQKAAAGGNNGLTPAQVDKIERELAETKS